MRNAQDIGVCLRPTYGPSGASSASYEELELPLKGEGSEYRKRCFIPYVNESVDVILKLPQSVEAYDADVVRVQIGTGAGQAVVVATEGREAGDTSIYDQAKPKVACLKKLRLRRVKPAPGMRQTRRNMRVMARSRRNRQQSNTQCRKLTASTSKAPKMAKGLISSTLHNKLSSCLRGQLSRTTRARPCRQVRKFRHQSIRSDHRQA